MESKCSMYMWDEFSDHRKPCGNAIYIYVHVRTQNLKSLHVSEQFPYFVCHT